MDKMKMETVDGVSRNIDRIAEIFPNCITEVADGTRGGYKRSVSFELLKQMLSDEVVDGDEAYEFTWVGKKAAIAEANRPIRKTLRPLVDESMDWNSTGNIYIKGDNLDSLKLLQESYLGKVDLIYIDPPYNTGGDFVYPDSFLMDKSVYDDSTDYFDEEGNINYKRTNSMSEARYHSDWCSMIYSRLLIARNYLSEDGVIYISIDDNELSNMLKICDEVFGASNFVANIIWQKKYSPQNDARWFSVSHDYILCIAKNKDLWKPKGLPRTDEMNSRYSNPDNDPRGPWKSGDILRKDEQESGLYKIVTPSGRECYPHSGTSWRFPEYRIKELIADNRIWFGPNGDNIPSIKRFLSEVKQDVTPQTIWTFDEVGHNQIATQEVRKLFNGRAYFDTPKPVSLIKRIIHTSNIKKDGIVMDFFAGSSTTAHAVMEYNIEEEANIKYILMQLPEPVSVKSSAYEDGLEDICDIGLKRINIVSKKYGDKKIDTGVRVFSVDSSNVNDVYYSTNDYSQDLLNYMQESIKSDRSSLDLLFGCLTEWGIPLTLKCTKEKIGDNEIIIYDEGSIIACLDKMFSIEVIKEIAHRKPLRVLFRDDAFKSSGEKINSLEIFKAFSVDTTIKVI